MASKSLELNDLYKLNPLAQIGLALGVIALILALAYFVLYSGQLDELKAAEAEEITLKSDFETKAKPICANGLSLYKSFNSKLLEAMLFPLQH